MAQRHERSFLKGAAILAAAAIIAKIVGALFKLPLYNLLGTDGTAHFNKTYQIYTLLLAISYSGIPVALSRLISASRETGNTRQTARYFKVALPAFALVGAVTSAVMFLFAPQLAAFMKDPQATTGIRVLSPAVFLCCVLSVYEGFAQGHEDMLPTAIKQLLEVFCKLLFGMAAAIILLRQGKSPETTAAGAITGVVVGLLISLPVLMHYKLKKSALERASGTAKSVSDTLLAIFRVSVPVTLGASFMSILTLLDSRLVSMRLEASGLTFDAAINKFGIYSQCQVVFNLPASLVAPVTVSIIPAISAAVAGRRRDEARGITESAMKLICLIAMPAAVGISALSGPIFRAFYGVSENSADGARVLAILGAASFFVCSQLLTTSVLQANGHERVPMLTYLAGGIVQLALDYVLVGDARIGIIGSPIGTLACYASITVINLVIIGMRVPEPARVARTAAKPLCISAVMGVAAYSVYGLTRRALSGALGTGRSAEALFLAAAVIVAVAVYAALIIVTRTITREDLKYVPKGDSVARFLRLP